MTDDSSPLMIERDPEVSEEDHVPVIDPQLDGSQDQKPLIIEPMSDTQPIVGPSPASTPAVGQGASGSWDSAPMPPINPADQSALAGPAIAALDQRAQATQGIADAQTKGLQEQASVYNKLAQDQQNAEAEMQKHIAPIEAQNKQLFDGILNGKVDHNRLYNNMSTGNKVLAAISVALGGVGAGLTGGPNTALQVMEKSIDRDIESQRLELGKKQTLFSENLRLLGDTRSAALATKAQLATAAQAKIQGLAAQSGSQQAQLNAKVALSQIDLEKAKMNQEIALRQVGMRGGNFDPALLVPRLVPADRQKEVFEEMKKASEIKRGGANALSAFDKSAQEQSLFSKNAIPGVNSPYIGQIKAAVLPEFQNIDGTVRQAAMDAFLPTITPQIGDSQHKIDVKKQTLQQWLISHSFAPTAKGFGIDISKFDQTNPQESIDNSNLKPRLTQDGRIGLFDPNTKKFVRYQ